MIGFTLAFFAGTIVAAARAARKRWQMRSEIS